MPVLIVLHLIILTFGPLQAFLIDPAHGASSSTSNEEHRHRRRRGLQVADVLNFVLVAMCSLGIMTLVPACVLTYYIACSDRDFRMATTALRKLGSQVDPSRPFEGTTLAQLLQVAQVLEAIKDKTYCAYIAGKPRKSRYLYPTTDKSTFPEYVPLGILCLLLAIVNACSLWTVRRTTKTAERRVKMFPDGLEDQMALKFPTIHPPMQSAAIASLSSSGRPAQSLSANKLEPMRSGIGSIVSASTETTDSSLSSVHDQTLMVDMTKLSKRQLAAIAGKAEHGLQGEKARQLLALYAQGTELTLVASLFLALSLLGFGLATWFLTLVTLRGDEKWPWSTQEAIFTVIQWSYALALLIAYPWLIYGTWCSIPEAQNKIMWPSKCILRRAARALHGRIASWRSRSGVRPDCDPELMVKSTAAKGQSPGRSSHPSRSRRTSVATPYSARRAPYSPTAQGAAPSGRVRVVIQETVTEEYRLDALVSNSADVSPFFVSSTEQCPATNSAGTVQPRSIETVIEGGFAQPGAGQGRVDDDEIEATLGCGGGLGIEWNKPSWAMLDADLGTSAAPQTRAISDMPLPMPTVPTRARLSASPSRGSRLSVDSLATVATAATSVGLPKITSAIGGAIPWEWQRRLPPASSRPPPKTKSGGGKHSALSASSLPAVSQDMGPSVLPRSSSA
ncbi:hypothetical protein OIV83_005492 [Microbotryomycetes sp. JL201]|nr:hypothetical protein OIV83_005492 [Microbotryomycetes sp. JL201]